MNYDELTKTMIATGGGDYPAVTRLMVRMLSLLQYHFPPQISAGLDEAKHYWYGVSNNKERLEGHRINAWEYLDQRSASTDFTTPHFAAIRAAICLMYPEPESDDLAEMVDFFIEMIRNAMPQVSDDEFLASALTLVLSQS